MLDFERLFIKLCKITSVVYKAGRGGKSEGGGSYHPVVHRIVHECGYNISDKKWTSVIVTIQSVIANLVTYAKVVMGRFPNTLLV